MPAIRCLVLKANEKTIVLQLNSVVVNWVSLLILEKKIERYRASGVCHGGSWYHVLWRLMKPLQLFMML